MVVEEKVTFDGAGEASKVKRKWSTKKRRLLSEGRGEEG